MDRRTFFASLAGFAALTQLRAAAPTAPSAPPTLPPAAAPASIGAAPHLTKWSEIKKKLKIN
jgi:hypothetical protein